MSRYKTCKGCPQRTVEPNCHSTCPAYLEHCKQKEDIRKKRVEYNLTYNPKFYKSK